MKIGLFFGSFNPVHIGHLVVANYMLEFTDLQKIWFVLSPKNPFKEKKSLLADYHRLELLNRALDDESNYKVCRIELSMPQPSYTADTLAFLRDKYPTDNFVLIMGADNLTNFVRWKNYQSILNNHQIYVYNRPGSEKNELALHPQISFYEAPQMQISSSLIRKAIQEKRDVRFFLPKEVYIYMREMHFYE